MQPIHLSIVLLVKKVKTVSFFIIALQPWFAITNEADLKWGPAAFEYTLSVYWCVVYRAVMHLLPWNIHVYAGH